MSGGIKGTREQRILDWTEREHADYVFGKVMGKSRRLEKLEEVEDEVLREGWLTGEGEAGFMQSWVKSCEYDWTAEQVG